MQYFVVFLTLISSCFAMDNKSFEAEVSHWEHVFNVDSIMIASKQVSLEYIEQELSANALGFSHCVPLVPNSETPVCVIGVLNDEGYDKYADHFKMPRLTAKQKHYRQRESIVHELVHLTTNTDQETDVIRLTGIILRNGKPRDLPKEWQEDSPPNETESKPATNDTETEQQSIENVMRQLGCQHPIVDVEKHSGTCADKNEPEDNLEPKSEDDNSPTKF